MRKSLRTCLSVLLPSYKTCWGRCYRHYAPLYLFKRSSMVYPTRSSTDHTSHLYIKATLRIAPPLLYIFWLELFSGSSNIPHIRSAPWLSPRSSARGFRGLSLSIWHHAEASYKYVLLVFNKDDIVLLKAKGYNGDWWAIWKLGTNSHVLFNS